MDLNEDLRVYLIMHRSELRMCRSKVQYNVFYLDFYFFNRQDKI